MPNSESSLRKAAEAYAVMEIERQASNPHRGQWLQSVFVNCFMAGALWNLRRTGDSASEAASKVADYFNGPPSVVPTVEQIILRTLTVIFPDRPTIDSRTWAKTAAERLNNENWLLSDATQEELDQVAAVIADSFSWGLSDEIEEAQV